MTERLHFHFSLSCPGEGNGNPLQCSCLENPRDRVAWWAAIYGGRTESDTTEATWQQQQQEVYQKIHCLICVRVFCLCFPLRVIVSGLTFRSLVHFDFIFVNSIRECSNLIFFFLHVAVQFSQHHLLKRLSFLHYIFLSPLLQISLTQVCGFISGLSFLLHWPIFLFLCHYHTVLMTSFVV